MCVVRNRKSKYTWECVLIVVVIVESLNLNHQEECLDLIEDDDKRS